MLKALSYYISLHRIFNKMEMIANYTPLRRQSIVGQTRLAIPPWCISEFRKKARFEMANNSDGVPNNPINHNTQISKSFLWGGEFLCQNRFIVCFQLLGRPGF